MQKFKELLCRIFGHKWECSKSNNKDSWSITEWTCSRCGATTVIRRR